MGRMNARIRSGLDLSAMTGLVALDQWCLEPLDLRTLRLFNFGLAIFLGILIFRRVDRIPRGFRLPRPGLGKALAVVSLATAGGAILLCSGAWAAGLLENNFTLNALGKSSEELPVWFLEKILTVLGQQLALFFVVFPLSHQITKARWSAALLGSLLFGLLHAPNPCLAVASFFAGLLWFWLFLYTARLWLLVLSHLVLVILVRTALPAHVHLNLKIGAKALPYLKTSLWLHSHGFFPLIERFGSRRYYEEGGGTDREFISGLYRDLLARGVPESEEENAWWRERLEDKSRTEVVILFLLSREYLQKNGLDPP